MRLYLVQHGDALAKDADAERPLSDRGRKDIARLASLLIHSGASVDRILFSTKRRARETASILNEVLNPEGGIYERSGMGPQDDVEALARELDTEGLNQMIVGHLPHLGRLATLLLTGIEKPVILRFVQGTAAVLERAPEGHWMLAAHLPPDLV